MENTQAKKNTTNKKNIETESENMDENQKAKFFLKFLTGSRKASAVLKFGIRIQTSNGSTITLESNPSVPFVVITNECQYEVADGRLLKMDLFGQLGNPAPWSFVANRLQRHFLRATRQDLSKPPRWISHQELNYIHSAFFGRQPNVTSAMFDEFWNWFGKGLQKLRYTRHLCSMWQQGLIYGFIPRETVNSILLQCDIGTYLIRFSERHAGTFAVGYVIDEPNLDDRIRHYLIKPEDVFAGKKTLPEFLQESHMLLKALQIRFDQNGTLTHRVMDKSLALEQYGAKRPGVQQPINGYDPKLVKHM